MGRYTTIWLTFTLNKQQRAPHTNTNPKKINKYNLFTEGTFDMIGWLKWCACVFLHTLTIVMYQLFTTVSSKRVTETWRRKKKNFLQTQGYILTWDECVFVGMCTYQSCLGCYWSYWDSNIPLLALFGCQWSHLSADTSQQLCYYFERQRSYHWTHQKHTIIQLAFYRSRCNFINFLYNFSFCAAQKNTALWVSKWFQFRVNYSFVM